MYFMYVSCHDCGFFRINVHVYNKEEDIWHDHVELAVLVFFL